MAPTELSQKTQVSLEPLEHGMRRLQDNVKMINEDYLGDIDLRTLLPTLVENLHAISHFKNETFTALQYAKDFGTISKESLKRTTKWGTKHFTHEKSYCSDIQFGVGRFNGGETFSSC